MEAKPSIPSSNSLPVLCLLALLACIGPLSDLTPQIWLHPNIRSYLENPSFVYICCTILICTHCKHSSMAAYLTGALGLAWISLPLPLTERFLNLGFYSLCFCLIACWSYFKLPMTLLFIIFCLDLGVSFQFRIFFDSVTFPLTPLSWQFLSHPNHFFCLLILPMLAFGFRKLRP